MPAFEIQNKKAKKLMQQDFINERELHALIDKNLKEIFGFIYIKDEHITGKHGRIETLAIDESNRMILELGGILWKAELPGQKLMMERMDPHTMELMRRVRTVLDPNGIMNPGNWEEQNGS